MRALKIKYKIQQSSLVGVKFKIQRAGLIYTISKQEGNSLILSGKYRGIEHISHVSITDAEYKFNSGSWKRIN